MKGEYFGVCEGGGVCHRILVSRGGKPRSRITVQSVVDACFQARHTHTPAHGVSVLL